MSINIDETDIRYAFMNPYYDGPIGAGNAIENRFLRIGFDKAGNLLEIMYNEYGDIIRVVRKLQFLNNFH